MRYHPMVCQALEHIEAHLEEDLTLESVAAAAGFSMFHFHRIFLIEVGKTVAEYIRSRRLAGASTMLLYTAEEIINIAFSSGFESQEAFTRSFKKEYGMPPGRYRKLMGNVNHISDNREENKQMTQENTLNEVKGWILSGSDPSKYEMGTDRHMVHMGKVSGYLKSITAASETQFATIMQTFKSDKYKGQRVKLSAFIKAEEVEHFAGAWMRVDNEAGDIMQFDNMSDRPIKGNQAWNLYSIVLDVPTRSASISFGVLLTGEGRVWMDGFSFEVVDHRTPSTNMEEVMEENKDEPTNLSFEE